MSVTRSSGGVEERTMGSFNKRFTISLLACVVALGAFGTAVSFGDDGSGTPDDQSQLLDVSKQVASIQDKMNQLIARGQEIRAGRLAAAADCTSTASAQVFLPWGDTAAYTLAPEGDLATVAGWTLNKQSTVATDTNPFTGAAHSLQFSKGGDAATPAMCVTVNNPAIRFFIRDQGGNGKSNLKVDVLYEDFSGKVKHLTIAKLRAGDAWTPSLVVPMYMNMLANASATGMTAVAFEFKAEGLQKDEALSISSLYVDPYASR
jgi:hypothetical protein